MPEDCAQRTGSQERQIDTPRLLGTEGREGASEEEAFAAVVRSDASVPTSVGRGRSIEMRPVRRGKRTGKLAARITDQRQFELQLASLSMSNLPAIDRNRARVLPPLGERLFRRSSVASAVTEGGDTGLWRLGDAGRRAGPREQRWG